MKLPDGSHPISIACAEHRVRVRFAGHDVADSGRALVLREARYAPVFYVPRADVDMDLLALSSRTTYCPYKGDASYWSLRVGGTVSADAAWSYETPYPAMAAISGHLAFYPRRVDDIIAGD